MSCQIFDQITCLDRAEFSFFKPPAGPGDRRLYRLNQVRVAGKDEDLVGPASSFKSSRSLQMATVKINQRIIEDHRKRDRDLFDPA